MKRCAAALLALAVTALQGTDPGVPLPPAPVRLVIPDAKAFDQALHGGYRTLLHGTPKPSDPLMAAWRRTPVGSKLEDQWIKFSESLPLTWEKIQKFQPRSVGLAILDVGNLEAVLVLDTPLAVLPLNLPKGEAKTHAGVTYMTVVAGAGDKSEDRDRRMGLAWAHKASRLFIATSERALKLALDEAVGNRGVTPTLAGFACLELDLDALRKDRYFKREFLFEQGPETGCLQAALRLEQGHIVEVRQGLSEPRQTVPVFPVAGAAAAGWEPEGTEFWPAFRRGLLEPIPAPANLPQRMLRPLPEADMGSPEDRYSVDFTRPKITTTAVAFEKGDLDVWGALLSRNAVPNWGYWISPDGARRIVFLWPADQDGAFLEACKRTVVRRAGRATAVTVGDAAEIRVGPALPVLALRRTGNWLWVGPSAASLKDAPQPVADASLVRWAHLELESVRLEAARWAKVEGPWSPERSRAFSDRVLGLLGWMPTTKALSVERRKSPQGWSEKVVFVPDKP